MAWTTPIVQVARTLITATIWNRDIVDNLIYLKDEQDKRPYFSSGSEILIVSSNIETSILPATNITGNLLGTNKLITARIGYKLICSNGGNTFTVRIKYGGTTLVSIAGSVNGQYGIGEVVLYLRADGAANAQEAASWLTSAYDGSGGNGLMGGVLAGSGTAAIDSTALQALDITFQWATANSTSSFKTYGSTIWITS
jgi:hypothetical protein